MGRAKTNAKQKSNIPILFPHDGPVFHLSRRDDSEKKEYEEDISLKSAIETLRVSNVVDASNGSTGVTFLIAKLFHSLQRANTTTKEQLQALQTFKCSFINLEKHILEGKKLRGDEDWKIVKGVYRLLLEWSLSHHTPLPFQRAIQANLKMIGSSACSLATANNKVNDLETICNDVMASIWKASEYWEDRLHSLDVAINYTPLREILQKNLMTDCLAYLGRSQTVTVVLEERQEPFLSLQVIDNALRIASMLKMLVGNWIPNMENPPRMILFENFVFALLAYPKLPSDGFNTLGILYGKLFFLNDSGTDTTATVQKCITTVAGSDSLSSLARLSMVQGIAATLDAGVLIAAEKDSPLELCWEYSLRVGQTSTDPMVRWAAIKGLSTLASRWKQQHSKKENDDDDDDDQHHQEPFKHMGLVKKTLDLVFDSWENPPLRKLGMAIPGLFKALVQLLPKRDLGGLFQQVLNQPASRKGRYLALEILLPYLPAASIQENQANPSSSTMMIPIESLLEGIGDRGANAGSIANLWIKVLKRAWQELTSQNDDIDLFNSDCFESWKNYWMPSFCQTMVDTSLTRRKQVVAFCLPRIADLMKEFNNLRDQLPLLFVGLLRGIEACSVKSMQTDTFNSISDRVLWAELEVTRYSSTMKVSDERLDKIIANCLHRKRFRFALVHSLPFIRIAAFRAMECVVSSYGTTGGLEEEVEMWRYALPYSIKTNESKEYISNLLQCLSNFLDRLSGWEAGINAESVCDDLPIFQSFAIEFLVNDLILTKASYPGTISDKEAFGVSLLDCLLAFSLQDESYGDDNTILKKSAVFNRKRSPKEENAMNQILKALLRQDVLSSLFGLLHSIWDNTRAVTFQCLTKLAVASQSRKVALANEYHYENQRKSILARGIYLASSPRQRESDTGARMICFLYASSTDLSEKDLFLSRIVNLSKDRVSSMKSALNDIILGHSASTSGSCLPLAHGLVHAIRLCVDHDKSAKRLLSISSNKIKVNLNESMIEVFCKALQLSLSVVADVRDGEAIDGIDETALLVTSGTKESDSTPLNVNTGAIGANGTFSSVSATNTEESKARLAMQRVVVGSWLLTKETCAAIASVITIEGYTARHSLVSKVGQLLLSTLTTLKHAGAAFAARDALQQIVKNSLNPRNLPDIRSLPYAWSCRLIDEISLNEKVRNSTLRRSTGYALGFLAIMRADVGNKSTSSIISVPLLQKLLMLSLPSKQRIEESLARFKIFENQADKSRIFVYASESNMKYPYTLDSQYQARCRVHALNVLRMIILDAPLASVISPLVGDTIISAILGYDDPSWAIRNSSTMVFAAAMLRVIDSDKNASNSDKTASNAITLTELFRRYPPLSTFIASVLRTCLEEMECQGNVKSEMFPILLMLSRVQPVMDSTTTIEEFVPLLFRCLGSKDHGIRHAAARSLANLSSKTVTCTILSDCKQRINHLSRNTTRNWNLLDGILLVMDSLGLSSNTELFDSEAQKSLMKIVNSIDVPPSCRSTALGILVSSNFVDNDAVRRACNAIATSDNIQFMIGGSLLYKSASEALCLLAQENLWQAASESVFENSLSQLKRIFVNDIIDVRLYAVKRFKKDVYENLDRLRTRKIDETALSRTIILNGCATMLLDCVAVELGRGIANSAGSHIPTLRRLSRCLLETLHEIPKFSSLSTDYELIWSISQEITEREYSFLALGGLESSSVNFLDSNGGNVLSSNAVEMMALAIAMEHDDLLANENGREHCQTYDRMEIVLNVVGSLNDPNGSWRSRYSAALALETCCCVLVLAEDSFHKEVLLRKMMMTILEMLQDSDPDVRIVAVRAATKVYAERDEQHKDDSASANGLLLPEWTLERTFPLTFGVDSTSRKRKRQQSTTARLLQAMILDNCKGLIDIMQNMRDEFSHTDQYYKRNKVGNDDGDALKLKALVNVNSTRKIFEDEDPNPFQEKILLNQLAIQSLLALTKEAHLESLSSSRFDFELPDNTRDVLTVCDYALIQLRETRKTGGMIHEISRHPSIFPSLHSILCASAAVLYMVGLAGTQMEKDDGQLLLLHQLREKLQLSAKKLLSEEENEQSLHASILCAVRVLTHHGEDPSADQLTNSDVKQLLFLLEK